MAGTFAGATPANTDASKWNVNPECDRSNMFYGSAYTGRSVIKQKL